MDLFFLLCFVTIVAAVLGVVFCFPVCLFVFLEIVNTLELNIFA